MTTEEEYQQHLDTHPSDWDTRLLFADWLDERRDPRGPGYRALAVQKRCPLKSKHREVWWWFCPPPIPNDAPASNDLWHDLFSLLPVGEGDDLFWPVGKVNGGFKTRRECEDAVALAFTQLPSERQVELLTPGPTR